MSREYKIEKAHGEFREFVSKHRASNAHTSWIGRPDPDPRRPIEVEGGEVFGEFMREHPEWEGLREEIREIVQPMYSLDYEMWQKRLASGSR